MAKKSPNYYLVNVAGHKEPAIVKAYTRNSAVLHIAALIITARLAKPEDMIGVTPASIVDATIEAEPIATTATGAGSNEGQAAAGDVRGSTREEATAAKGDPTPVPAEPAIVPLAAVAPQADPEIAAEPAAQPQDGSGNADVDTIALATEAAEVEVARAGPPGADEDPADAAVANEPLAPQAELQADSGPAGRPLDGGMVAAVGLPSWMQ